MAEWWNQMTLLQQIFFCAAAPASLILILQTILLLIGIGSGGMDGSLDSDTSGLVDSTDSNYEIDVDPELPGMEASDADLSGALSGLRVFTIRGLVAFFSVGGWLGLALLDSGMNVGGVSFLALIGGLAAMVAVALIFKWAMRLQDSGNISLRNAVGQKARVYLTIPAGRRGAGKVTMTIQERFIEAEAITDESVPIKTGSVVQVKGLEGDGMLIVTAVTQ